MLIWVLAGAALLAVIVIAAVCMGSGSKSASSGDNTLFHSGLMCVCVDGKYSYVDSTGTYVITPQFDNAYAFGENGLARVCTGSSWGYIDTAGSYVINPQFDSIISAA